MHKYVVMGVQARLQQEGLRLTHVNVGDIFRWRIQKHICLLASFACCLVGCAEKPIAPKSPEDKIPVRTITLDEMKFPDPIVGEKLRQFDALASRTAGQNWVQRPYTTLDSYGARGVYIANWSTLFLDDHLPHNYRGPEEVHFISLSAVFDADAEEPSKQKEIVGLRVYAKWKPAGAGWAAILTYETYQGQNYPRSGRPQEKFDVRFEFYRGGVDKKLPRATILGINRDGAASWSDSYSFGGEEGKPKTIYEFTVSTFDSKRQGDKQQVVPDADVRRILASAEDMRDFGLASLDALLQKIETDIPLGRAFGQRPPQFARALKFREKSSALDSDRKLTEEEQQQILNEARREVQGRIETLRDNYQEMYAALMKAFDLKACLDAAAK